MTDVFDGVLIEKHTGQGRGDVAYLRNKYGPGLTFTATGGKLKVVRAWERSQVQTITLHFEYEGGAPASGMVGAYFWPNSPEEGVRVQSDANGNIDWNFSQPSFYDPRFESGPYIFRMNGLELRGLGSPSKNMPYNHDSVSFDIVVNPTNPDPVPPPPPPGNPYAGMSKADVLALRALLVVSRDKADEAVRLIDRILEGTP